MDLEFALLLTLGDTVYKMSKMFGHHEISIKGPKGEVVIERPVQDPSDDCLVRLALIVDSARDIAIGTGIDYSRVIERLLVFDGWSWNESVFRAPIWLNDHRELPIAEARKLEGLKWLRGTSLEIKSEPQGGLDVSGV